MFKDKYLVGEVVVEDIIDPSSGEYIAEEGDIVSKDRVELINLILEEIVKELAELVLEGLSSNPIGYSSTFYRFLVESRLGLEVIELTFTLVEEEDPRYLDLVGLLG